MNKRQAGAFWEEAVTAYLMRSGVNIWSVITGAAGEKSISSGFTGAALFFLK